MYGFLPLESSTCVSNALISFHRLSTASSSFGKLIDMMLEAQVYSWSCGFGFLAAYNNTMSPVTQNFDDSVHRAGQLLESHLQLTNRIGQTLTATFRIIFPKYSERHSVALIASSMNSVNAKAYDYGTFYRRASYEPIPGAILDCCRRSCKWAISLVRGPNKKHLRQRNTGCLPTRLIRHTIPNLCAPSCHQRYAISINQKAFWIS